jgi:hypothetical protein
MWICYFKVYVAWNILLFLLLSKIRPIVRRRHGEICYFYTGATFRAQGRAPSGYNFQPWRFLVLRDAAQRAGLQEAAFNQANIAEAPVMIWQSHRRHGSGGTINNSRHKACLLLPL